MNLFASWPSAREMPVVIGRSGSRFVSTHAYGGPNTWSTPGDHLPNSCSIAAMFDSRYSCISVLCAGLGLEGRLPFVYTARLGSGPPTCPPRRRQLPWNETRSPSSGIHLLHLTVGRVDVYERLSELCRRCSGLLSLANTCSCNGPSASRSSTNAETSGRFADHPPLSIAEQKDSRRLID